MDQPTQELHLGSRLIRDAPAGRRVRSCQARWWAVGPATPFRSTGISRSIETTSTACSTRSMPRGRTMHTTGTAPRRHQRRRRRASHAACSRTRARWRSSYVLVLVSTTNATPVGAIANESISPRPRQANDDAAATRPPEVVQVRAGPRPPSEHQRGCARRATASGERRARARRRGREGAGRGYRPRAREGQREQHARTARDRCRSGSLQPPDCWRRA